MSNMVRKIALELVPVGARVAIDVCDAKDSVLIAAGTELNQSSLSVLKQRGITQLHIEIAISAEEAAVQRKEVVQRLAHLFRFCNNDPLMRRLHDVVKEHRLEQLK